MWTLSGLFALGRNRWFLLGAFCILSASAWGTTYYIDATNGSDSYGGTTTARPWKTLSKISNAVLNPGDSVLFKRGETWRGQLNLSRSGSAASSITLDAYGSGADPLFDGSDIVTSWTSAGANLYTTSLTTEPDLVVFNGVVGTRVSALGDLDAANEWYWASNVLTIYSASAPSNMEVATKHFVFAINNANYLRIQNMSFRYAIEAVCLYQTTYVVLDHITVRDGAGMGGIIIISDTAGKGEHNTVQNSTVYNCIGSAETLTSGNNGCGIFIYGQYSRYNTVTSCSAHHLGHEGIIILGGSYNTISGSTVYQCAQSGFRAALETATGNVFEGNVSYENGQKVDDRYGIDLIRVGNDNIVRYNLVHDQHDTLNDPNIGGNDGHPKYGTGGIRFDGGDWTDHDYMNSTGNKAYYNVVYNETICLSAFNFSNIQFYNNVAFNSRASGIAFASSSTTSIASNDVAKNNIVHSLNGSVFSRYRTLLNVMDYNVYFSSTTVRFSWDYTLMNFATWKSTTAQEANSQAVDPLFVNASNHDFHLQSGSPCVDHGVSLGFTRDFDGVAVPQRAGVDVGAFELATPTLTVTSPNGGESYEAGQTATLTWTYTGDPGANVKIELLNGASSTVLADSVSIGSSGSGSWVWTIPQSQAAGANYSIRVTPISYPSGVDSSNAPFTISVPTLTVTSPNGGESWVAGNTYTIQWNYTGSPGANVRIDLSDGTTTTTLAASTALGSSGTGSWSWTIPAGQTPGVNYKVVITSTTNAYCSDTSNAAFTILAPTFTVSAPNGGEVWYGGETHRIQWTYTGNPGANVKIELMNGSTPTTLAASVSIGSGGAGYWDWTIPAAQSDGSVYRIRVTSTSTTSVTDTSDANFTIHPASVTVTSPNGGETWLGGESHAITWTYTGAPGANVKIELLNGASATTLVASVAISAGSWTWTIPADQADGSAYRIRITSTDTGSCTDTSNSTFTIHPAAITVVSPNGGESWVGGEAHTLTWTYSGVPGTAVDIALLNNGTPTTLASGVSIGASGSGSWNWTIPVSQAPGAQYQIRVTSTSTASYTDTSNANFSISAPTVSVTSPNGGESWVAGTTHALTWNFTGVPGQTVNIELFDGSTWTTLAGGVAIGSSGAGSWNWQIPLSQASGSNYKIRVTCVEMPSVSDSSNAAFTITGAVQDSIVLVSPNGGESWGVGQTKSISWSYTGDPGQYVLIELLNGASATTLAASTPIGSGGTGSWSWSIPLNQPAGSQYRVRITSTTKPANTDTSYATFTITAPTVTVTSPNGGETWVGGQTKTISWNYTDNPGPVKIELLDGSTPTVLVASTPVGSGGSGSWDWTIPPSITPGNNYTVRITSVSNSYCTDSSNATFSIAAPALTVVSPNGGESWNSGETRAIQWTYSGVPDSTVQIELLDGGVPSVLATGVSVGSNGSGSWSWPIPIAQANGSDYTIRVTCTNLTSCTDTSNAAFSITNTALSVASPTNGETWVAGETRTIRWNWTGNPGSFVKIELLDDGASYLLSALTSAGTGGAGSWNWSIPAIQTPDVKYQIRVTSLTLPACTGTSAAYFNITGPAIEVQEPNGGETWVGGDTETVRWTYAGNPGANVRIELLNGSTPTVLAASVSIGSSGAGSWNWTIPPAQPYGTDYTIRITSTSLPSCTDTSDAPFAIAESAISVGIPNGGETWETGQTHTVSWTYAGNPGATVRVELLRAGIPSTLATGVSIGSSGSGSWNWTIPLSQSVAFDYRLRVTSETTVTCTDDSDADFTITAPTISVASPVGGETWVAGDTHSIRWNYTGDPGATVDIELLEAGAPTTLISGVPVGASGTGSWDWAIPDYQAPQSVYRIRLTSSSNPYCTGASAADFTIAAPPPEITVTNPNGGETWLAGQTQTIQWSYTGDPGDNVRIELLTNGVATVLANSVPAGDSGTGSWGWNIPVSQAQGSLYRIRVTSVSVPACTDTSDGNFNITAVVLDTITVTSPNGEENWLTSDSYDITWTYRGSPGSYVKIELLKGGSPTTIASSVPVGSGGVGSWNWSMSFFQEPRSDYKIRITSTTKPACTDLSDDYFTISMFAGVRVEYPDDAENWFAGDTRTLRWSYAGDPASTIKIELLRGSSASTLATGVSIGSGGRGTWTWAIPANQTPASNYKIRITTETFFSTSDTSDSAFAINAPSVTVSTPNGGDVLEPGNAAPIRWTYAGNPGANVKIEVLNNGVAATLAASVPIGIGGTGSWVWNIPAGQPLGNAYRIRVTSTSLASATDTSDSDFAIVAPLEIVQQPDGGERIVGESYTFTVVISGGVPPYTYEWKKEGSDDTLIVSPKCAMDHLEIADAGLYYVTVTDGAGITLRSESAELKVFVGTPVLGKCGLRILAATVYVAALFALTRRPRRRAQSPKRML